jgi:hypothetical protein
MVAAVVRLGRVTLEGSLELVLRLLRQACVTGAEKTSICDAGILLMC